MLGDGRYELMIATPPGPWFVAGNIDGGTEFDVHYEAYAGDALGMPRFVDVRAGEVSDIVGSPTVFTPVAP